MKKTLLLSLLLVSQAWVRADMSGCIEKTFIVTAYYSPADNQLFYYKGNVKDEKILNGDGTHGASGFPVFNGMLAAPQSYPFGATVYFPGYGTGIVKDRGGAIVESGERENKRDRIDIWMGTGQAGLIKALTFGKKTLTGTYCPDAQALPSDPTIGINQDAVPYFKYFWDMSLWINELWSGRQDMWVRKLQDYLGLFGYLEKGNKSGIFDLATTKALCAFQVDYQITTKKYCGYFGKTTRVVMRNAAKKLGLFPQDYRAYSTYDNLIQQVLDKTSSKKPQPIASSQSVSQKMISKSGSVDEKKQGVQSLFTFYKAYQKGDKGKEILILQNFLKTQGVYQGKLHGLYDQKTLLAVYDFQLTHKLVDKTSSEIVKGFLGPKTRSKINELLNSSKSDDRI